MEVTKKKVTANLKQNFNFSKRKAAIEYLYCSFQKRERTSQL